jgi:hypothetical protein
MAGDGKGGSAYIQKVRRETGQFVKHVMAENDTLRGLVASLQSEKLSLWDQIQTMRSETERLQREQAHLTHQLVQVEAKNRRFSEEYLKVELENGNLANLYVASYRLHATLNRQEILGIIQEIIVNLIGSEELAIFEVDAERSALLQIASIGLEPGRFHRIPLGAGIIGRVGRTGATYLAEEGHAGAASPAERNLTACIALKVDGHITGAIAIFRLLQQKACLELLDRELLDLLATHAATALYRAGLHTHHVAAVPAAA